MLCLSISAVIGAVLSGAVIFPLHAQNTQKPLTAGELQKQIAAEGLTKKTAGGLNRAQAECVLANLQKARTNQALQLLATICVTFPERPQTH